MLSSPSATTSTLIQVVACCTESLQNFLLCSLLHFLTTSAVDAFVYHVDFVFQPIVNAVGDPFYKITSEALLVTQQLVKVLRPLSK